MLDEKQSKIITITPALKSSSHARIYIRTRGSLLSLLDDSGAVLRLIGVLGGSLFGWRLDDGTGIFLLLTVETLEPAPRRRRHVRNDLSVIFSLNSLSSLPIKKRATQILLVAHFRPVSLFTGRYGSSFTAL